MGDEREGEGRRRAVIYQTNKRRGFEAKDSQYATSCVDTSRGGWQHLGGGDMTGRFNAVEEGKDWEFGKCGNNV